jgi:hypothetical protein
MFRTLKDHDQVLGIKVMYSYTMNNGIADHLQYINKSQIINTQIQCKKGGGDTIM